ncbi:MAG: carbon-nitrogen hydrolase family protein [Deltaproteobacteria bacterium]|jgi:predicted amidohydrolase|nr:carbon-nitrogen hydrolase family protein [Deltaproteobacteria bacterium]MBW2499764.1 carbon-nitrogen hydrolase family protein [Deltaproteobacteria bacterium]
MSRRPISQDLVTVASVNFSPVHGDAKATVDKMSANITEAAEQGADLVIFPELALLGCGSCPDCAALEAPCEKHLQLAETVPGPSTEAIAEMAREHDLYVVFGLPERDAADTGKLYNAAAVVGPEGVLGSYRKVHLGELPWVTEGAVYTPGTTLPLFPTRFGKIGVQICYDFWFNPELTRLLALKGARLIAVPVGSFAAPGRPDTMRATALARAQENLVHVAVSNSVGGPGTRAAGYSGSALTESLRPDDYVGHSMIAGPAFPRFGAVMAEAGSLEEIVVTTINLRQQARFEKVFDYRRWRAGRLASASRLIADEFQALADAAEG